MPNIVKEVPPTGRRESRFFSRSPPLYGTSLAQYTRTGRGVQTHRVGGILAHVAYLRHAVGLVCKVDPAGVRHIGGVALQRRKGGSKRAVRDGSTQARRVSLESAESSARQRAPLSTPLPARHSSWAQAWWRATAAVASGGKKPLVLFTYLDAQEHLPYADDSTAVTPKSELNGGIVVDTPTRMGLARKLSYNSHTGKLVDNSYNSHTDLRYPPGTAGPGGLCSASGSTKEGILTKRMASLFNESMMNKNNTVSSPNSIVLEPITDMHHRQQQGALYDNESGRLTTMQNPSTANAERNNFITNGNGKDSVDLQVG